MPFRIPLLFLMFLVSTVPASAQTYIWDGGSTTNNNWGTGANWVGNIAPVSSSTTTVVFNYPTEFDSNQNIANPFVLNALSFTGVGNDFIPYPLSGSAIEFRPNGAIQPILLLNDAIVEIQNPLRTTSSLTVIRNGTSPYAAVALNGLTGGNLKVNPFVGVTLTGALSHGLEIDSGQVQLTASNQLNSSNVVTMRENSILTIFGSQSIGGMQLTKQNTAFGSESPKVLRDSDTDTINLNGNITYVNSSGLSAQSIILPNINLGASTRMFSVSSTGGPGGTNILRLNGTITSATAGVGLTKTDAGRLTAEASWSFSGPTTINDGVIEVENPNILAPLSSVVLNGGRIEFGNTVFGFHDQQIGGLSSTLATSSVLIGTATMTTGGNHSSQTYAGSISGTGRIIKIGNGVQNFSGDNSTSFTGSIEVQEGVLAVTSNNALGASTVPLKTFAGGTLQFTESTTSSRTIDQIGGGTLAVAAGKTLSYQFGKITGGYIQGPGGVALVGSRISGTTIQPGAIVSNAVGTSHFQNVTSGGTHTFINGTVNWTGGQLTAAGRITVNVSGNLNTSAFESIGTINIINTGEWVHSNSPLVLGGGSVTNVGAYNPATGVVTPGGTINLGTNDLVVRGGLLRNNGVISTTGNLVVDFGGIAKGAGDYDVGGTQLINGGQFLAGNSPGLVRNSNLTVIGPSLTGGDLNNASGTVGGFASSANGNTTNSGWSAIEYGNSANTASGLTLQRGAGGKAQWQFRTTLNDGIGNTPGAPANFDPTQSYSWEIFRPRTNASASIPDPTAQLNTVATITLLDPSGNPLANTDANLNATLEFNRTLFLDPNTGLPISPAVGNFTFAFGLDLEGRPGTTITLLYQPVPEPKTVLAVVAMMVGVWFIRRVRLDRVSARSPSRIWAMTLAIIAVGIARTDVHAQTFTWDGGGANNNWNTTANWTGTSTPPSSFSTIVVFSGTTRLTPVQNIAAHLYLTNFNFQIRPAHSICRDRQFNFKATATFLSSVTTQWGRQSRSVIIS
jgi:autotransporter-associated beta strand protein